MEDSFLKKTRRRHRVSTMRKRYDKEFKAKVAIEAMKGEKTIQEIATQLRGSSEYDRAVEKAAD